MRVILLSFPRESQYFSFQIAWMLLSSLILSGLRFSHPFRPALCHLAVVLFQWNVEIHHPIEAPKEKWFNNYCISRSGMLTTWNNKSWSLSIVITISSPATTAFLTRFTSSIFSRQSHYSGSDVTVSSPRVSFSAQLYQCDNETWSTIAIDHKAYPFLH